MDVCQISWKSSLKRHHTVADCPGACARPSWLGCRHPGPGVGHRDRGQDHRIWPRRVFWVSRFIASVFRQQRRILRVEIGGVRESRSAGLWSSHILKILEGCKHCTPNNNAAESKQAQNPGTTLEPCSLQARKHEVKHGASDLLPSHMFIHVCIYIYTYIYIYIHIHMKYVYIMHQSSNLSVCLSIYPGSCHLRPRPRPHDLDRPSTQASFQEFARLLDFGVVQYHCISTMSCWNQEDCPLLET